MAAVNPETGEEGLWGDGPCDIMLGAVEQIREEFLREWERLPEPWEIKLALEATVFDVFEENMTRNEKDKTIMEEEEECCSVKTDEDGKEYQVCRCCDGNGRRYLRTESEIKAFSEGEEFGWEQGFYHAKNHTGIVNKAKEVMSDTATWFADFIVDRFIDYTSDR